MRPPAVHASCVSIGGVGILIRGTSGSGKSDLVLRLIDAYDAKLVADDQVELQLRDNALYASPPANLAGQLEIRGQGIVTVEYMAPIKISAVIDLAPLAEIDRMPEAQDLQTTLEGIELPRLKLYAPAPSAPARIKAFLKAKLVISF